MTHSIQAWKRAGTTFGAIVRSSVAVVGVSLITIGAVHAQTYPSKPIRVVLQLPPGSIVDVAARLVAPPLSARLGQPVVVENRPGGGGIIAAKAVASAAPDGYTLLFVGVQHVFAAALSNAPASDSVKDFTAIAAVVTHPWVLVVPASVPARSVRELVDYAKANPGKLNWGFGQATGPHLFGELFVAATGINVAKIPYKGGTQAVPDMLGGRIQMNVGTVSNLVPLIEERKDSRACGHRPGAQPRASRCADHGRSRTAASDTRLLDRTAGAGRHPGRHRHQAQQRDQRNHGDARDEGEHGEDWFRAAGRVAAGLCEIHRQGDRGLGRGRETCRHQAAIAHHEDVQ